MAALLFHDAVTERGVASVKTRVRPEGWNISILLYKREVRVPEEGERVGPVQWEMGLTYWYWSGKLGELALTSTSS